MAFAFILFRKKRIWQNHLKSEDTSSLRISVAISACLLGEPVRYDGRDKFDPQLIDRLRQHFVLVSICPEVAIGMGVPRPPVQLVQDGAGVHACGVEEPSHDVTDLLASYGHDVAITQTELCGYVFKARSPSCGLGSAPLFDINGRLIGKTNGVYANAILTTQKVLPVADEEQLQVQSGLKKFVEDVLGYADNKKICRRDAWNTL